jgi:hypothetical protein
MEIAEAYEMTALMRTAWPHAQLTREGIAAVWMPRLEKLDHARSKEALDALIESEEFPPTVARFLEAYRAVARRQQLARPALPSAEPVSTPEQARAHVAEIAGKLAEAKGPLATSLQKTMSQTGTVAHDATDAL